MNKKQYEEKRDALMKEAKTLLDSGKAEEAQKKMDEVEALDNKWDAIVTAQANLQALTKDPKPLGPIAQDMSGTFGENGALNAVEAWESDAYVNAWTKKMMGKELCNEEEKTYKLVNEAYTHATGNTSIVIPKTVSRKIWEEAGEMYPYFDDIDKTYVDGVLALIQEESSSDAKWYDEETETEDGKETFKEYTLSGCELARSIPVSWKLKEMSMDDFIPYIQRKLAAKMGAAAGYGMTHGEGANATSGKPEPLGVVTALKAEEGTPNVVTYKKDSVPSYSDLTTARSKIKSSYASGLKIYANNITIWTKLANVLDQNKRPIFIPDPTGEGVYRVLGMVVKEDDSMKDGEILMSNAERGYSVNINKEMTVMLDEQVKKRKTEYCGYAIMDGAPVTLKAHALLEEAAV